MQCVVGTSTYIDAGTTTRLLRCTKCAAEWKISWRARFQAASFEDNRSEELTAEVEHVTQGVEEIDEIDLP